MIRLYTPADRDVISREVRSRILDQSSAAASRREVAEGIFDVLLNASVDPFSVSLEEYKVLLVDAIRAAEARR
jgi:hypothetical protein